MKDEINSSCSVGIPLKARSTEFYCLGKQTVTKREVDEYIAGKVRYTAKSYFAIFMASGSLAHKKKKKYIAGKTSYQQ